MKSLRKIKENVSVQSADMEWDTAEMYRQISAPTETVKGKEQAAQELLKEIEFVEQKGEVFSNNQKTPLYDFYSVDKNSGVYKKVAPQFDANFQTSESSVAFEISEEKGIFKLNFSTPWNRWQKEIKVLNAERLVLYHQERNFNYKRVKFEKSTLAK